MVPLFGGGGSWPRGSSPSACAFVSPEAPSPRGTFVGSLIWEALPRLAFHSLTRVDPLLRPLLLLGFGQRPEHFS